MTTLVPSRPKMVRRKIECAHCGRKAKRPYPAQASVFAKIRNTYCSPECARAAYDERRREERRAASLGRIRECASCGHPFQPPFKPGRPPSRCEDCRTGAAGSDQGPSPAAGRKPTMTRLEAELAGLDAAAAAAQVQMAVAQQRVRTILRDRAADLWPDQAGPWRWESTRAWEDLDAACRALEDAEMAARDAELTTCSLAAELLARRRENAPRARNARRQRAGRALTKAQDERARIAETIVEMEVKRASYLKRDARDPTHPSHRSWLRALEAGDAALDERLADLAAARAEVERREEERLALDGVLATMEREADERFAGIEADIAERSTTAALQEAVAGQWAKGAIEEAKQRQLALLESARARRTDARSAKGRNAHPPEQTGENRLKAARLWTGSSGR